MRGSDVGQVTAIIKESFEEGYHKHEIKGQLSGTNREKCEYMKIGSYATMDKYSSTWYDMAAWCRSELGIKDITKIDKSSAAQYLEHRAVQAHDGGLTKKSFGDVISAVHRLSVGINQFQDRIGGDRVDWHSALAHGAQLKAEMVGSESRIHAYERPSDLVNANFLTPQEKVIGKFILETGARISEVWKLKERDIASGTVVLHGKGGLDRTQPSALAPQALSAIKELKAGGYTQNDLRNAFMAAAKETGQQYQAVHGLRHNYAQNQVNYKMNVEHKSELQAKAETSRQMGHFRVDIIETYMK